MNITQYAMNITQYSDSSYSTIFQCTEDTFTCLLRFMEGVVSLTVLVFMIKGYRAISMQSNNPISNEDKNIYLLAMSQTLLITFYYFLFEQFFVLATIRNLLIWMSINILELFCKIYWIDKDDKLRVVKFVIRFLAICNFLLWFIIAVSDGSELINTSFNLGYNCLILDWVILSGLLVIIAGVMGTIGLGIIDKLNWQIESESKKEKTMGTNNNNNRNIQSLVEQKNNILLICIGSIAGALIMFFWDYLAYMKAQNDQMCVEIFSGNTAFRKILCFLLKIFSMQVVPTIIFYSFYYKKRSQFLLSQQANNHLDADNIDYLRDDAASDLNRSLTDRQGSRRSLYSGGSTPYL